MSFADSLRRERGSRTVTRIVALLHITPTLQNPWAEPRSFENKAARSLSEGPRFGSAKGLLVIADDFDEPLAEFEEYM
ncbi:MAG TPA: DUF2281 domain-containing protein [Blastocatellia bacterium]